MNQVRQAWQSGRAAIGAWQGALTQLDAEQIGALGYDFVLIDLENSGLHWDSFIPLTQAVELGGTRTMVRVPTNDAADITRALDYGAIGVVVPMVNTAQDAARAAGATRYYPMGYRPNGQIRRGNPDHAAANTDVVCVVMIETGEGWHNLEDIVATAGVDAVMIGQVDLALALGWQIPANGGINIAQHVQARAALGHVAEICAKHSKIAAAAGVGSSKADVQVLVELGVRWFGYSHGDRIGAQRARKLIEANANRAPEATS